jgi:hypothetical protein
MAGESICILGHLKAHGVFLLRMFEVTVVAANQADA